MFKKNKKAVLKNGLGCYYIAIKVKGRKGSSGVKFAINSNIPGPLLLLHPIPHPHVLLRW